MRVVQCRSAEIFDDPDGPRLIEEYSAECGNALIGKPAPRRDMYAGMEASGLGHCFAAYEQGRLKGFAMLIVSVVPHYGLSCATLESIFVTRGAHCGAALMQELEGFARGRGCTTIFYVAPVGSRFARLLFLEGDRYTHTNHVFSARLK